MARDHELIDRARAMRRAPTPAEDHLWRLLRANRTIPAKFSRQVVIGPYIVDCAARAAKLIVELDGASHDLTVAYDERRTAFLESKGYRLIRFRNADLVGNADGVLEMIRQALATPPLPAARCAAVPPPAGGGRAEQQAVSPLPTLSPEERGL